MKYSKKQSIAFLLIACVVTTLFVPAASSSIEASTQSAKEPIIYDTNDYIVTEKRGIKRILPKVSGLYPVTDYPIPNKNVVPDEDTYNKIKEENAELMKRVDTDIANGTLTKHIAADGQFYGTIQDDVTGVEKSGYINTNLKGYHSLAAYVPAGEIAQITLGEEALKYAKKGQIEFAVGMVHTDALDYSHNHGTENRMPYLGKKFYPKEAVTKVGTHFGGMIFLYVAESVPQGLQLEFRITGVVDTPYYDLGQTTAAEWKEAINAPGLFAEIRTPYLRFIMPAQIIRHIEDPYKAVMFWNNVSTLSSSVMGQLNRTVPMTLIFDQYVRYGVAFASVGGWTCNLPTSWAKGVFDYDSIMRSGDWGMIHEINHHYQKYQGSSQWGLGDYSEYDEITNNVLSAISYVLYTNIAAYRTGDGASGWNRTADPYSSLKQQVYESKTGFAQKAHMGIYAYCALIHEIGPENFIHVIRSIYEGGTFHGTTLTPYDFSKEKQGGSADARYDDLAYRICVIGQMDLSWYLTKSLHWPLTDSMLTSIKNLGYEQIIPVQNVYAMGQVGQETGRPFYIPSLGYTFDFEQGFVSPAEKIELVNVSKPKYGTLNLNEDGTYEYEPDSSKSENDQFILTVKVTADGITYTRKLNCEIAKIFQCSKVEHYSITKWDIEEALGDIPNKKPYKVTNATGMKIVNDQGNNLAMSKGYFQVEESGKYEIQSFGDDTSAFMMTVNGNELKTWTNEYAATAQNAYSLEKAGHITVELVAGEVYPYTLVSNNHFSASWADVNIRKMESTQGWKSITRFYVNQDEIGNITDRIFPLQSPVVSRPITLAVSKSKTLTGLSVIKAPKGVVRTEDPNTWGEDVVEHMIDGDESTYFHSAHSGERDEMPHQYVFDLGDEKVFDQVNILARRSGEIWHQLGDYRIYASEEYKGEETKWNLLLEDKNRQDNNKAPANILENLPRTKARYVMLEVLNNRSSRYSFSVIAEFKLLVSSNVNNVIAENSGYIAYSGDWINKRGAYVNGNIKSSDSGTFSYSFTGKESSIYVTDDAQVEIRINDGEWKLIKLTGSLREPSYMIQMDQVGNYHVEVRGVGEQISLNMLSTDGNFGTLDNVINPEATSVPVKVTLNKTSATIYTSGTKTVQLKATVSGASTPAVFSSSNTKVAKVSNTGLVTAVTPGTATITVKVGGVKANCKITVKKANLSINKATETLFTTGKKTFQLTAKTVGASQKVTYVSSNTKVLKVSSSGKVTAISTGKATVKVSANGLVKNCVITVKKPVLTVSKSNVTVKRNKTVSLSVKATPATNITYKSSNEKVAKVSKKGVVTGVKAGKVSVTITANGVKKVVQVVVV